jgi:hypothetical protein
MRWLSRFKSSKAKGPAVGANYYSPLLEPLVPPILFISSVAPFGGKDNPDQQAADGSDKHSQDSV